MREKKGLQKKVESLISRNKSIEDKNKELEKSPALQNERLEKLEQIELVLKSQWILRILLLNFLKVFNRQK